MKGDPITSVKKCILKRFPDTSFGSCIYTARKRYVVRNICFCSDVSKTISKQLVELPCKYTDSGALGMLTVARRRESLEQSNSVGVHFQGGSIVLRYGAWLCVGKDEYHGYQDREAQSQKNPMPSNSPLRQRWRLHHLWLGTTVTLKLPQCGALQSGGELDVLERLDLLHLSALHGFPVAALVTARRGRGAYFATIDCTSIPYEAPLKPTIPGDQRSRGTIRTEIEPSLLSPPRVQIACLGHDCRPI